MHARLVSTLAGLVFSSIAVMTVVSTLPLASASASQPFTAGSMLAEEDVWVAEAADEYASEGAVAESAYASGASTLEDGLFNAVNEDRVAQGLAPLQWAPNLHEIARARAQAQQDLPSLSHYDGSGQLAFVVLIRGEGIRYRRAGENLARIGGNEATRAVRAEVALMNSPTHRANILESNYTLLAVGEGRDSRGNTTFAQIFLNP